VTGLKTSSLFTDLTYQISSLHIPSTITSIDGCLITTTNYKFTIYCEIDEKPAGWNSSWNSIKKSGTGTDGFPYSENYMAYVVWNVREVNQNYIVHNNNTVTITHLNTPKAIVPSQIEGMDVVALGLECFKYGTHLFIPKTVETIHYHEWSSKGNLDYTRIDASYAIYQGISENNYPELNVYVESGSTLSGGYMHLWRQWLTNMFIQPTINQLTLPLIGKSNRI